MAHTIGTKKFNPDQLLVINYITNCIDKGMEWIYGDQIINHLKMNGVSKSREGYIDLIQRVVKRISETGVNLKKVSGSGRGKRIVYKVGD